MSFERAKIGIRFENRKFSDIYFRAYPHNIFYDSVCSRHRAFGRGEKASSQTHILFLTNNSNVLIIYNKIKYIWKNDAI